VFPALLYHLEYDLLLDKDRVMEYARLFHQVNNNVHYTVSSTVQDSVDVCVLRMMDEESMKRMGFPLPEISGILTSIGTDMPQPLQSTPVLHSTLFTASDPTAP
jgi:hypothetical protein